MLLAVILFGIVAAAIYYFSKSGADVCSCCGTCEGYCMTISAQDIATYARNAGFDGNDLVTAVAVALAESGGNSGAYNPETAAKGGTPEGQGSVGLWQIYTKKHPEFAGQDLHDPQTNANAAFSVYSAAGQSFTPWSTYTSGKYSAYMQTATEAVSA